MSDNPRPVLYGSGYEAFLPRAPDAPRPRGRVVGKHCESGDVVVAEAHLPGRPGGRRRPGHAGHRRLRLLDGLQLQPGAPAAGGLRRRRARPGWWCARETLDDLLRLESEPGVGRTARAVGVGGRATRRVAPSTGTDPGRVGRARLRQRRAAPWPSCCSTGADEIAGRTGLASSSPASPCARPGTAPGRRPSPPPSSPTDAEALVAATRRRHRGRAHRRHRPARTLVEAALRPGTPVVTANKALLAEPGAELADAGRGRTGSTCSTRRRWPARSRSSGPCASRWPASGSRG